MNEPTPYPLILPCASCRAHAHVTYTRAEFSEDNFWVCPSCGEPNRLRFKGKMTTVKPYAPQDR